jgi:hypothetical protein
MKSDQSMGLVIAGGLNRLFLSRMPTLLEQLGPVKASSFHVARREANSLRAGYAVSHYSALELCSLIWIAVPEDTLDRVMRDMAAQMPVHSTMVVLCDMVRDSSWPNPLRKAGARMASINLVGETRDGVFMGEGHEDILRAVRRLFARERRRFIEVLPTTKATYFAGLHFGTQFLLPWIDAAASCLRAAGLTRAQATQMVETLCSRTVRAYVHTGRKAWDGRSAAAVRKTLERDAETLGLIDGRLGDLYAEGIRLVWSHFGPR